MKKKIIILGNQARALSNFWTVLITKLVAAGHEVICLIPKPETNDSEVWEDALRQTGSRLAFYKLDRKGLNPINDSRTFFDLYAFLKKEKPDILFASTIKPVIYGSLAAAFAGFPKKQGRHLMVTGLGYMFEGDSPIKRLLMQLARLLYKVAFKQAGTVYFQNNDDKALFNKLSITNEKTTVNLTKGTGVDIERFPKKPIPEGKSAFLFVGRLLEAKGLRDFCLAAEKIKAKYPEAMFSILGPEEQGPGAFPLQEVMEYQAKGVLSYLGATTDVRPYLEKSSVIVLPSWREGTPCSLMEAMSTGRPVIAADAPGSREVVRNNENGLMVPVRNPEKLAQAMEYFIQSPEQCEVMGNKGRARMEEEFSADCVAEGIIKAMGL